MTEVFHTELFIPDLRDPHLSPKDRLALEKELRKKNRKIKRAQKRKKKK